MQHVYSEKKLPELNIAVLDTKQTFYHYSEIILYSLEKDQGAAFTRTHIFK